VRIAGFASITISLHSRLGSPATTGLSSISLSHFSVSFLRIYEALSYTGCNFPFIFHTFPPYVAYYFYYYFIHRHRDWRPPLPSEFAFVILLVFLVSSFCVVYPVLPQPYSVSPFCLGGPFHSLFYLLPVCPFFQKRGLGPFLLLPFAFCRLSILPIFLPLLSLPFLFLYEGPRAHGSTSLA
jgi:hypothetical protein